MIEENKWNNFEKPHKNNLLTLNLFFYFPLRFLSFYIFLYFISLTFSLKISKNQA